MWTLAQQTVIACIPMYFIEPRLRFEHCIDVDMERQTEKWGPWFLFFFLRLAFLWKMISCICTVKQRWLFCPLINKDSTFDAFSFLTWLIVVMTRPPESALHRKQAKRPVLNHNTKSYSTSMFHLQHILYKNKMIQAQRPLTKWNTIEASHIWIPPPPPPLFVFPLQCTFAKNLHGVENI